MEAPQKVTFTVSARNLSPRVRGSTGLSSIPDPYVKISLKDRANAEFTEVHTTKHFINNSNPDWLDVISFEWRKNSAQKLRVDVLDKDVMNKDDVIGSAELDVDNFLIVRRGEISTPLSNTDGTVHLKVTVPLRFRITLEDLPKLDNSTGSDPYVESYWSFGPHGELHKFHKTSTIEDARNAKWNEVVVFDQYQPGTNQYFTFKVYDEDTLKDDVIGSVSFGVDAYVKALTVSVHKLSNEKDSKNKGTIKITPVH